MQELDQLLASRSRRGAKARSARRGARAKIFEMSQGELDKRIAMLQKNQREP